MEPTANVAGDDNTVTTIWWWGDPSGKIPAGLLGRRGVVHIGACTQLFLVELDAQHLSPSAAEPLKTKHQPVAEKVLG